MRKCRLLSHDRVREVLSDSIGKSLDGMTDETFGNTIDASSSAVTQWRNQRAEMGGYFVVNAMQRHPAFLAEILASIGYKAVALTESELDDHDFTVSLATLQLKQARALRDGVVNHNELIEMEAELNEVGEGVECRRAKLRHLRAVSR